MDQDGGQTMEDFETIWERAAERHGGEAALKKRLMKVKSKKQLSAIPDDRWLSEMTKRVFQAGFVWKVIEAKWEGFEEAFKGFNPKRVAAFSDDDIDALLKDTRIVRNGQKIMAARDNAIFVCELAKEHGSAGKFFANWPDDDFIGLVDVMKKRGSRLGGATGQMVLRFMGRQAFMLRPDVSAALIRAGVVDKTPTSKKDLAAVQAAFNEWSKQSGRGLTHISQTLAMSIDG